MDIGQIKQKIKQNEFLKKIVFYSITSPKNPKPEYCLPPLYLPDPRQVSHSAHIGLTFQADYKQLP